jgi:hypothetical protein
MGPIIDPIMQDAFQPLWTVLTHLVTAEDKAKKANPSEQDAGHGR